MSTADGVSASQPTKLIFLWSFPTRSALFINYLIESALLSLGYRWGNRACPWSPNQIRTQQAAHLCRKQVSPLIQSLLYTTSLLQDLHYYLFLLTERNLKRIFASSIQHLFCSELLTDAEHSPQWQEQYRQTPALGTTQHFSIQSSWLGTEPMSIWASPRFILCVH